MLPVTPAGDDDDYEPQTVSLEPTQGQTGSAGSRQELTIAPRLSAQKPPRSQIENQAPPCRILDEHLVYQCFLGRQIERHWVAARIVSQQFIHPFQIVGSALLEEDAGAHHRAGREAGVVIGVGQPVVALRVPVVLELRMPFE